MPPITFSKLMDAISDGKIHKIDKILQKNPQFLKNSYQDRKSMGNNDDYGTTPWHKAAAHWSLFNTDSKIPIEIFSLFIKVAIENHYSVRELLNKQDYSGDTPLHRLCKLKRKFSDQTCHVFDQMVKLLVDNGIDMYIQNKVFKSGVFIISSTISMYYF